MRYILFLLCQLAFTSSFSQRSAPLVLENDLQIFPLDDHLQLFVDTTGNLEVSEIRRFYPDHFTPLDTALKWGEPGWSYWLYFQLITPDTIQKQILVMKNPRLPLEVDWSEYYAMNRRAEAHFFFEDGTSEKYTTGYYVPASERDLPGAPGFNAFPLPVHPTDTIEAFVQVINDDRDWIHLSMEARPVVMKIPFDTIKISQLIYFMVGSGLTLGLLAFFFYLAVGERSNLYFALSCLFIVFHGLILIPEIPFISLFIPEHPWLVDYFWFLFTHGIFILFILFGRELLDLKNLSPVRNRIFLVIAAGYVLNIVILSFTKFIGLQTGMTLLPLLSLAFMITSLETGFLRGTLSKIFAIGAAWLMLFTFLGILYNQYIFSWFNPWPFGLIGVLVVYGLGLALKIKMTERAKQEAGRIVELDAIKSRFFANISHEFRTPLSLIISPVQKILEQMPASEELDDEEGQRELLVKVNHLRMVKRNAHRLQKLINQLLDLSKLENASMKLKVREDDLIKFLRVLVFSFESLAERKKIHFQTRFSQPGDLVYFDRETLEKIVINLLSNAFKFTPEKGRVSVDINLERDMLKVAIEDSGPGIPKEDLDKIFERFFRSDTAGEYGTGIGLNLVKELVELHHGQISVESTVGKGTMFRFSIPTGIASFTENEIDGNSSEDRMNDLLPDDDTEQILSNNGVNSQYGSSVLIVEDNVDLRNYISEIMQTDYRVITAENGRLGWEMALEETPDIIISDIMMPEMNGISLCQKIKATPQTSHIPVILLTAKAGKEDELGGLAGGADHYLTKPFNARELMLKVQNLIDQQERLRKHLTGDQNALIFHAGVKIRPGEVSVTSVDQKFLEDLTASIEKNMDNEFFSVVDLASDLSFSRSQLFRKLKALTGKGPNEIIRDFRLARAKDLLEKGHGNVSEVAMSVGYSSLSYFTRSFKQTYGILPSEI